MRVFDPGAPLLDNAGQVVEPSDFGWDAAPETVVGMGAYVDLFWNSINRTWTPPTDAETPQFAGFPHFKSKLNQSAAIVPLPRTVTYDTWSFHYESDGLDQDGGLSVLGEF